MAAATAATVAASSNSGVSGTRHEPLARSTSETTDGDPRCILPSRRCCSGPVSGPVLLGLIDWGRGFVRGRDGLQLGEPLEEGGGRRKGA